MSAHNAGPKVLAESRRVHNQLGVGVGGTLEVLELGGMASRVGDVAKPSGPVQSAFLDKWLTGTATGLGEAGIGGGDSGANDTRIASSFGWLGGMGGGAGAGGAPSRAAFVSAAPQANAKPVPVPEPASLLLVTLGLAAFGIFWMRAPELAKQRISGR